MCSRLSAQIQFFINIFLIIGLCLKTAQEDYEFPLLFFTCLGKVLYQLYGLVFTIYCHSSLHSRTIWLQVNYQPPPLELWQHLFI